MDRPAEAASSKGADPEPRTTPIVAIGGSAGALLGVTELLSTLPEDLGAAVCVVLHLSPRSPSMLAGILGRSTGLRVEAASHGTPLRPGTVYVGVPDLHLVVEDGAIDLSAGTTENGFRPSVDRLFRSVAGSGGLVIGVVLSGSLDDGASGALAIRKAGGRIAVQDPTSADHPSMPLHALQVAGSDHVGTPAEIGRWVGDLLGDIIDRQTEPLARSGPATEAGAVGTGSQEHDKANPPRAAAVPGGRTVPDDPPGGPMVTCPDCDGALREVDDHGMTRYRCLIGHTWSPESLASFQLDRIDRTASMLAREMAELVALNRRLADRADTNGHDRAARTFRQRADRVLAMADDLRQTVGASGANLPPTDPHPSPGPPNGGRPTSSP